MKRCSERADSSGGVPTHRLKRSKSHLRPPDPRLPPISSTSGVFDYDELVYEDLSPALDQSIFQRLPDSLFLHIIQYCDPESLFCSVRLVCKRWLLLCRDSYAWRHQRIAAGRRIEDSQVLPVLRYATNLRCLDVSCCRALTSLGLAECLRHAPNLKELNVRWIMGLCDVFFDAVATHCPRLELLLADGCKMISNDNISKIAANRQLRLLYVVGCERLSDVAVESLSRHCTQLRDLRLHGCTKLTDQSLDLICNSLKHLRLLDLSNIRNFSPTSLMGISKLGDLEKLELTNTPVNEYVIQQITLGCPKLYYLHLIGCCDINDRAVAYVATRLKNMKNLNLGCNNISDASLVSLANSNSLEELDIRRCQDITYQGVKYLVSKLAGRLRVLSLLHANFLDTEVNELRNANRHVRIKLCRL